VNACWVPAWIGLGSNLDDPEAKIRWALGELGRLPGTRLHCHSRLYRNPPMGPPDQPDFVNAAAGLLTQLEPRALLDAMQAIERAAGRDRVRTPRWGPRPLDLDLLLYGELALDKGFCRAYEYGQPLVCFFQHDQDRIRIKRGDHITRCLRTSIGVCPVFPYQPIATATLHERRQIADSARAVGRHGKRQRGLLGGVRFVFGGFLVINRFFSLGFCRFRLFFGGGGFFSWCILNANIFFSRRYSFQHHLGGDNAVIF